MASSLALPDQSHGFELFLTEQKGCALGVLLQKLDPEKVPVAYLLKGLDNVVKGWPACLRVVVATVDLVQEAQKIILGAPLEVYTTHSVQTLLEQKLPAWATLN